MRLLTRADFDGLACGALLEYLGIIDEWEFVHPADVQNGFVEATENDVVANIPYIKGCKLWFDHHQSETERLGKAFFEKKDIPSPVMFSTPTQMQWEVIKVSWNAPSCARVVYEYYRNQVSDKNLECFETMLNYVDKVDSGNLTAEEILNPQGWILLGFIMDPRTGLGRFAQFTINNMDMMKLLSHACGTMDIAEILNLPDVVERVDLYFKQDKLFREMIQKCTQIEDNVIILDLREADPIYAGNRFLLYTLFPEQNISITLLNSVDTDKCTIAVGYSIINKTAALDVGKLLLKYQGGGHQHVGTCQVSYTVVDQVLREVIDACKQA
ncbi:MAG: exopolyphosphatase [Treponema sp.]|jgi:nanoRNase/pAp phosphatase (c-di-AMP/oligoRNAs hydrolase)|nr:exopolyphosphatase [Treponema sp.]